ncbi:MAG TPA: hypothetical protein PLF90_04470 [bacterium]|nr:hypothetical protein [bacterium]
MSKKYEEQLNYCKLLYGSRFFVNPEYLKCIGQAVANKKDCDEWAKCRNGPPGPYNPQIQMSPLPWWFRLLPLIDYIPWRLIELF